MSRSPVLRAGRSTLEYFVIDGPTPKEILRKYTALTGRPPAVPAWSFGLWLSTSFTTDYDEETVTELHRRHGRARAPAVASSTSTASGCASSTGATSSGTRATFPDPEGMLARLQGPRACGSASGSTRTSRSARRCSRRAGGTGYLVQPARRQRLAVGQVAGRHGAGRLHQPRRARTGIAGKLRARCSTMGVDCFKTDFGERIPTDVVWSRRLRPASGCTTTTRTSTTGPSSTLLERAPRRRARRCCSPARRPPAASSSRCTGAATASRPSTSMAETLRGGLSLAARGFGYWSHDIGGFEGTPDPAVFKRWIAVRAALLAQPAARHRARTGCRGRSTTRRSTCCAQFTRLKLRLMPYLSAPAAQAHRDGHADDAADGAGVPGRPGRRAPRPAVHARRRTCWSRRCSAPTARSSYYVPAGTWTHLLDRRAGHRPALGAPRRTASTACRCWSGPARCIPVGARDDRPGLRLRRRRHAAVYRLADGDPARRGTGTAAYAATGSTPARGPCRAAVRRCRQRAGAAGVAEPPEPVARPRQPRRATIAAMATGTEHRPRRVTRQPDLPGELPLGLGHGRVPDRGRRRRGRPRTVDLGHLQPHPGQGPQRRHR